MPKQSGKCVLAVMVAISFTLTIPVAHAQPAVIPQMVPESALHRAARTGDLGALQARLDRGIKADARDSEGRTALMDAVKAGHPDVERALVAAGANVNATTPGGRTPLIEAAEYGRIQSAQLLIQAGADLNAVQRGWGSALETAERTGHLQTAALLRQAGAKTFGRSVGDTVCVRPWGGNGYCGKVENVDKNDYRIRITRLVGCENGCEARAECSAGRPVGGTDGIQVGEVVATKSWCITHTGVQQ